MSEQALPTTIVIFGASGDLTRRKLIPALFKLHLWRRAIDPILQVWRTDVAPPLTGYAPRCWGPESADTLLARSGRKWRHSCAEHD